MPFAPTKSRTRICPSCDTSYTIDPGDDIPTTQCASPGCPAWLCPNCPQFHCDGCGERFCLAHMIETDPPEAPCTCIRLDVDYYDVSHCYACNPDLRPRPDQFCAAYVLGVRE